MTYTDTCIDGTCSMKGSKIIWNDVCYRCTGDKIVLVNDLITLLAPNYANKPLTYSLVGSIDRVSEKHNESNLISLIVWKVFGTLLFCVVHYWT